MQMLALVIQGTRLNRRNQPDPSRSFPNKRSGRRGKMLTFVTALKYQKDNRRVSLYATLHQPSHCFLRLLFFRPTSTMLWFSQALPLTLKTWRGQSWRQQCYEITHWPPCSLRQSGPIQLHGLQRYPVIAAAAFYKGLKWVTRFLDWQWFIFLRWVDIQSRMPSFISDEDCSWPPIREHEGNIVFDIHTSPPHRGWMVI